MLKSSYEGQNCSIARSLEVVGERWTLLVVRDLMLGFRRFDELQRRLGIARNVLAARLERLQDDGLIVRKPYQQRPLRYEYCLTKKGSDLWPALVALMSWGDRYCTQAGAPVIIRHRDCDGRVNDRRVCTRCGKALALADVVVEPGPGAREGRERGETLPAAT